MDLAYAQQMEHAMIGDRNVWHYMIATTIGEIHIVEHECSTFEIMDDYMGRSTQKAEQAFARTTKKIINGKA